MIVLPKTCACDSPVDSIQNPWRAASVLSSVIPHEVKTAEARIRMTALTDPIATVSVHWFLLQTELDATSLSKRLKCMR
mgnify:CR=1 FL=1